MAVTATMRARTNSKSMARPWRRASLRSRSRSSRVRRGAGPRTGRSGRLELPGEVGRVPAGLEAKVVDGDQRMWLRVPATETVVVLDYRGAPYLRFSPPASTSTRTRRCTTSTRLPSREPTRRARPRARRRNWQRVSGGHEYSWHDGRLHALATVALAPGTTFVGTVADPAADRRRPARSRAGSGTRPTRRSCGSGRSPWCCCACSRHGGCRRPALDAPWPAVLGDRGAGRDRAAAARPGASRAPDGIRVQLIELAAILAFVAWGLCGVLSPARGYFTYFVIAFVALWQGAELIPTLLNGFVLIALPAFVARAATVLCLGAGAGAAAARVPLGRPGRGAAGPRVERTPTQSSRRMRPRGIADAHAGGTHRCRAAAADADRRAVERQQSPRPGAAAGFRATLVAEARPIGRGARFHPPPAARSSAAACAGLDRDGVHVEVFAANRVVIVPAGIGTRPPRTFFAGRIARARCYGDLVTIDPTGLVLVRPGRDSTSPRCSAPGAAAVARRLASFTAPAGTRVAVFVNGRRRRGPPGAVPLTGTRRSCSRSDRTSRRTPRTRFRRGVRALTRTGAQSRGSWRDLAP